VVAVDGDLGLNNLDVAMGVEGKISYDIFDCLDGRCRIKQALVQSPWHKNLYLLPACFGKNRYRPDVGGMRDLIGELGRTFDYVLVDCPAGIDVGFRRAIACSEEAIVVINPHISAIRDADKIINLLSEARPYNIKLAVNKMRGDLAASGEILTPQEIADILKVGLIGVIPEDDAILSGLALGRGRSGRAFALMADNLIKNKSRVRDYAARYTGVLGSIRRKLKKML